MKHVATTIALVSLLAAGCSDDSTSSDTTVAATSPVTSASATSPPASSVIDAAAYCDEVGTGVQGIPFPSASDAAVQRYVDEWRALEEGIEVDPSSVPPSFTTEIGDVAATRAAAADLLTEAAAQSAAGDVDAALVTLDRREDVVFQMAAAFAAAGQPCLWLGPERVADSRLAVPVLGAWQVALGFGSVWVAREFDTEVVRLDPSTGEITATIDVGGKPFKMQPADGRMWVRTADAFVAVDPTTNEVTDSVLKSDVGPDANRSWAVDGGLWVCDGRRVHRLDPTTVDVVASIDLDLDCDQVFATDGLVIAWTYNEGETESGESMAEFIDPASNTSIATVDLPADAGVPVVLDDRVVFPGFASPTISVVDRASWTVIDEVDAGVQLGGSQNVGDATALYVPARGVGGGASDVNDVLVLDPVTLEEVDRLVSFGVNSVAMDDEEVWLVNNFSGFVQAFER